MGEGVGNRDCVEYDRTEDGWINGKVNGERKDEVKK